MVSKYNYWHRLNVWRCYRLVKKKFPEDIALDLKYRYGWLATREFRDEFRHRLETMSFARFYVKDHIVLKVQSIGFMYNTDVQQIVARRIWKEQGQKTINRLVKIPNTFLFEERY